MAIIDTLHIYPIKSCGDMTLEESLIEVEGLAGDRRAMVVDKDGRFITRRTHPHMADIHADIDGNNLVLRIKNDRTSARATGPITNVTVWKNTVKATCANDDANALLSAHLGEPVRLVFMGPETQRPTDPDWADGTVSFADGYPILIANTASLAALSETAGEDISMRRFRPNIVIKTETPWIEDNWQTIRIGDVIYDLPKPCTRCVMTTQDPDTGKSTGNTVMQAMIDTRRSADPRVKGVLFGVNAVPRSTGSIKVGQAVEILETRDPWPIMPTQTGL